ncbi:MAG: VPLPA-CTERM sorting domain-containing protein [Pseudomonadota bacterium]|nr:VPLPA-CTERM sorting domain-containing protein [Pseudomonadota bacterium]MEC9104789.1 VPLPA-CTERM sorting domain-containing protein [Pseudomonadota bacterium]
MKTFLLAGALMAASTGLAQAGTLDFVAFGAGTYGSSISLGGATITNTSGGNILVGAGAAGAADGFCSLNPTVFNCEADTEIAFSSAVKNLSFDIDGTNPGDAVALSIYGLGNLLITTLNFSTPDQTVDLSSYGAITRLLFDDSSTGAGVGYSTFTFDLVNQVPVPAGLPLMVGGLAAFGALRRKKA